MNPTRCPYCGRSDAAAVSVEREVVAPDGEMLRFSVQLMRCASCASEFYTDDQSLFSSRARADVLRAHQGRLTPTQIRAIRRKYGLSQAALEEHLGAGPKTVVRWERGTVCQNGTADKLLRVLDAMGPGALEIVVPDPSLGFSAVPNFVGAAGVQVTLTAGRISGSWPQLRDAICAKAWKTLAYTVLTDTRTRPGGGPPGIAAGPVTGATDTRAAANVAARAA